MAISERRIDVVLVKAVSRVVGVTVLTLGCASGQSGGGAQERNVATTRAALTTVDGCGGTALVCNPGDPCYFPGAMPAGTGSAIKWCSGTVGPGPNGASLLGSATYDSGVFTISDNQTGLSVLGEGQADDRIRYVYTQWQGNDVEMVLHVRSTSSSSAHRVEAGVMLRDAPAAGGLDDGTARMATLSFLGDRGQCGDDKIPTESQLVWGTRLNPGDTGDASPKFVVNSQVTPPELWLRLQRIGGDFATASSHDGGQTWTPLGAAGGSFVSLAGTNPYIGFYVALWGGAAGHYDDMQTPGSALFDITYLGPPRLNPKTTWIGASAAAFSTGAVTRGGNSFYAAPDGTTYKTSITTENTVVTNIFPPNGVPNPILTGTVGNFGGEGFGVTRGGITGDYDPSTGLAKYVYVAKTDNFVTPTSWWIVKRDPNQTIVGQYPSTTCPRPDPDPSPWGQIGGLAAQSIPPGGSRVFVSDVTHQTVHVLSWPDGSGCPSEDAVLGAAQGITRPGPLAVDVNGKLWIVQPSIPYPDYTGPNDFVPETIPGGALRYPPTIQCVTGPWTSSPAPSSCGAIDTSTFSAMQNPVAIAASRSNAQLVIADNGVNQDLISCNVSTATPSCNSITTVNGVFSSTGVMGQVATGATQIRLFSPMGVGFSGFGSSESLWVADQAPGVAIHKLDQTGVQATSYTAPYGFGEEPGAFDPLSPGDYYTLTRHLKFDTSKTAAGSEWSLNAVTFNPFDNRIAEMTSRCAQDVACTSDSSPNTADTYWDNRPTGRHNDLRADQKVIFSGRTGTETPILRHLPLSPRPTGPVASDPLFMYVPYTIAGYRHLAIFRFEGEIAVPVGSFEFQPPSANDPAGAPAAIRLWVDTPTNPDGVRLPWPDTSEVTTSTALGFVPRANARRLDVDAYGNIWFILGQYIWKFPLLGVTHTTDTAHNVERYVPNYSLASQTEYQLPSTVMNDTYGSNPSLIRVDTSPDGTTSTAYLQGYQTTAPDPQCGFNWVPLLGAYDVSAGTPNHAIAPTKYEHDLPWGVGATDEYKYEVQDPACMVCSCAGYPDCPCASSVSVCARGSTNAACACGQNAQTPGCACAVNPDWGFNSLSAAGDYVFLGEQPGMINVLRKSDGTEVANLFEGPEESGMTNYTSDIPENVKAVVTSTGEYLVTESDVSDLARTSVFRWTPPAFSPVSFNPSAWYVASAQDIVQSNGSVSVWMDRSANQHNLTQSNPWGQPTFYASGWNGNPTLTFAGHNVLLADWTVSPSGLDQPFTVLAVARSAAVQDASLAAFANYNSTDGARFAFLPSGSATYATFGRDGESGRQLWSPSLDASNISHVFVWRYASDNALTVTVDSHVYTTTTPNPEAGWTYFTNLVVGARNTNPNGLFTGDISELVIVPTALSDNDVQTFRTYAMGKWSGLPQ